jgi:pimeloyl-ACP methyl ester carboxylesterase
VRNGETRIAYELRGAWCRRPWLVLIQGMGLDRRGWEGIQGKLRRRFRLVLVDNRGCGRSERPAGSFTVADMAGDVVAVLDAAGIRRAHVLGASLGGMVAQELAIRHPERIDALVLACTTPGWPFAYPMPAPSVRLIAATARLPAKAAWRRHMENALSAQAAAGARYAGRLRQAGIRARTLVLHGGADTVVDPRNGRLLADRIPRAKLRIFPELGHLFFWEEPDGFVAAVTSFLTDDGPELSPGRGRRSRAGPGRPAGRWR